MISHDCIFLLFSKHGNCNQSAIFLHNVLVNIFHGKTLTGNLLTDLFDHFGIFTMSDEINIKQKPKNVTDRQINDNNTQNVRSVFKDLFFGHFDLVIKIKIQWSPF